MDYELSTNSMGPSRSTTTVDTEGSSIPDDQEPRVDITDISFSGHVACRWRISLVSTYSYDCAQALQALPNLNENHARIYDTIAGESTSLLARHIGPLFDTMPRNGHSIRSPLEREGRSEGQGNLRFQWSQAPGSTSQWNPLCIPCTNFLIRKQYDDLELGSSTALISCRTAEVNKLLGECFQWIYVTLANLATVLYERPYSADENLMTRPLGETCPDIFEHYIPPENGRPRVTFVKILLLGLFHHHINRLTSICRDTFPFSNHEMLYKGVADIPKTISQVRNCTEFHKHIYQLTNMTEFTAKNVEIEIEPLGSSPKSLIEYILEIRYSSAQLTQMSQDNMDRYKHGWDTYRELLNVHGSEDVKRLTILATIFLPLSLPPCMLAMNTRFADLGPLLYDFVGVSFLVGAVTLILYYSIIYVIQAVSLAERRILSWVARKNSEGKKIDAVALLREIRIVNHFYLGIGWIGLTTLFLSLIHI